MPLTNAQRVRRHRRKTQTPRQKIAPMIRRNITVLEEFKHFLGAYPFLVDEGYADGDDSELPDDLVDRAERLMIVQIQQTARMVDRLKESLGLADLTASDIRAISRQRDLS